MARGGEIMGAATDFQYWGSLFLLAVALAFVLPAIFVLPSDSNNKTRDYFRHVGITASWFGGIIGLVWLLEAWFERSNKASQRSRRKYRLLMQSYADN
jgi:low temperature requirement protein LtrA